MSINGFEDGKILSITESGNGVEDIYDAPTLLNLSRSCGNNGFDASPIFSELTPIEQNDPYLDKVVLAMPMKGYHGSTDIKDLTGKAVTVNGDTKISVNQGKFDNCSCYFDGSGDYLSLANSADFNFGASAFTVEAWIYLSVVGSNHTIVSNYQGVTNGLVFNVEGGTLRCNILGDNNTIVGTTTIVAGVWYHAALSGASGSLKLFLNGQQEGNTYTTGYNHSSTSICTVGVLYVSGTKYYAFNGYIDDLRITKGAARYTESFTPPTASVLLTKCSHQYDPDWDKVVLAMPMTGINGSTSIPDLKGQTITNYGSTSISSSKSKFGYSSCYFDGSNDYISTSPVDISTGDFTIEFWINSSDLNSCTILNGNFNTNPWWRLGKDSAQVFVQTSSFYMGFARTLLLDGKWHHVSLLRIGNNYSIYLDGSSVATASDSNVFGCSSSVLIGWANSAPNYFNGYIQDLRITKGLARYTTDFTPKLDSVFNVNYANDPYWQSTVLATQFDGIDGQKYLTDLKGKAIAFNGDAKLSTTQKKFGATSVYFDGIGDYLSIQDSSDFYFAAGEFTIELWLRVEVAPVWSAVIGRSNSNLQNNNYSFSWYLNNGVPKFSLFSGNTQYTSIGSTLSINTWHHLVVVRTGNSLITYVDGIAGGVCNIAGVTTNNTYNSVVQIGLVQGDYPLTGYIDELRITKGIARYTENFTPPAYSVLPQTQYVPIYSDPADEYWSQTVLAMKMDGANNSTTFTDLKGKTVTASGDAKISTTQSKFGGSSAYFDGVGDYISTGVSSDFSFGSGNFTEEAWIYVTAFSGTIPHIISITDGSGNNEVRLEIESSSRKLKLVVYHSSAYQIQQLAATELSLNTWYHVAVSRSGNVHRVFLDGIVDATVTLSHTLPSVSWYAIIGWVGSGGTDNYRFTGYIDDLRITKGVARYTANFTPPTKSVIIPPPIDPVITDDPYWDNTVLAMTMEGSNGSTTFKDLRGRTFTNNGVALSTTNPKLGTSSAYFDSGDYLSFAAHSDFELGTEDFTFETWVRLPSSASYTDNEVSLLCAGRQDNSASGGGYNFNIFLDSLVQILRIERCYASDGIYQNVSFTLPYAVREEWYHVVIVRSAGVFSVFWNGMYLGSSNAITAPFSSNGLPIYIGMGVSSGGAFIWPFTGYRDDIRLTKGIARYSVQLISPPDDTSWNNVTLALPMDGIESSKSILDLKGKTISPSGNVRISTTQSKFGNSSVYFDGVAGTKLTAVSSLDFAFPLDFTVEFWINPTVWPSSQVDLFDVGATGGLQIGKQSSGFLSIARYGQAWEFSTGVNINTGSWTHLAVVRSGTTLSIYFNGVSVGSYTTSTSFSQGGLYIGGGISSGYEFTGYIDDLRITKGIARYTANFTTPTQSVFTGGDFQTNFTKPTKQFHPTLATPKKLALEYAETGKQVPIEVERWDAITRSAQLWYKNPKNSASNSNGLSLYYGSSVKDNTVHDLNYWNNVVLALPMNGVSGSTTFTDLKGKTVTASGNAQISTTQSKFGGSSAYFDGTGDYLTIPTDSSLDIRTKDFVIEGWFYKLTGSNTGFFQLYPGVPNNTVNGIALGYDGTSWQIYANNTNYQVVGSLTTNSWLHIAFVRHSGVIRLFINGKQQGSITCSADLAGNSVNIGLYYSTSYCFNGYMNDFRFTIGAARYTENFTPPNASYFSDTNFTNSQNLLTDTFTGNDGDIPRFDLWNYTTDAVINNNRLRMTGTTSKIINSSIFLGGDFDIQVDLDASSLSTTNSSVAGLYFIWSTTSYPDNWAGVFRGHTGSDGVWWNYQKDGAANITSIQGTTVTTTKLRILRVDGICSFSYWNGSAWVWNGNFNAGTQDVQIRLAMFLWDSFPNSTAYFDNFKINYADRIYGKVGDIGTLQAQQVWSNNYEAVYHLSQDPSGTVKESTRYGRNATSSGSMTSSQLVDMTLGNVKGKAIYFDAIDDHLYCGTFDPKSGGNVTLEATAYTSGGAGYMIAKGEDNLNNSYGILDDGNNRSCLYRTNNGTPIWPGEGKFDLGYPKYTAGTISNTNVATCYLNNGTLYSGTAGGTYVPNTQELRIGATTRGVPYTYRWKGKIRSVRISSVVRSAAWISRAHKSDFDNLLIFTQDQQSNYDFTGDGGLLIGSDENIEWSFLQGFQQYDVTGDGGILLGNQADIIIEVSYRDIASLQRHGLQIVHGTIYGTISWTIPVDQWEALPEVPIPNPAHNFSMTLPDFIVPDYELVTTNISDNAIIDFHHWGITGIMPSKYDEIMLHWEKALILMHRNITNS